MDTVFLRNLRFDLPVGTDAWHRLGKIQPVYLSVEVGFTEALRSAAASDDVSKTMDYGKLYKTLSSKLQQSGRAFADVQDLCDVVWASISADERLKIEISLPKACLRAEAGLSYNRKIEYSGDLLHVSEVLTIKSIRCACIIGVNPCERLEKQIVIVDLCIEGYGSNRIDAPAGEYARPTIPRVNHQGLTKATVQQIEGSAYRTVEALATAVARTVTMDFAIPAVTVTVEKPNAIASIEAAGVRLRRSASFFQKKNFWEMEQDFACTKISN